MKNLKSFEIYNESHTEMSKSELENWDPTIRIESTLPNMSILIKNSNLINSFKGELSEEKIDYNNKNFAHSEVGNGHAFIFDNEKDYNNAKYILEDIMRPDEENLVFYSKN